MSNGTIDSSIWPVWYIGGGCSSMHGSGFDDVSNKYFNKHHNEQLMPKQCTFYIVCSEILNKMLKQHHAASLRSTYSTKTIQ